MIRLWKWIASLPGKWIAWYEWPDYLHLFYTIPADRGSWKPDNDPVCVNCGITLTKWRNEGNRCGK